MQSHKLESELEYYKESNQKRQFENDKEKYFNDLINTKLKDRIRESTKQTKEFEITKNKFDKDIQERDEEISRLRDHNQKLLLQIKKEKDKVQRNQKLEKKIQVLQQKLLGKDEEYFTLKKVNQELEDQIEKLKEDKQSQDEMFEKIHNNNNLLENKLVQIQKEASRLSRKQILIEEEETNTNSVPITVQKKVNRA